MIIPLAKVTFALSKRRGVCQRSVRLEGEEFCWLKTDEPLHKNTITSPNS